MISGIARAPRGPELLKGPARMKTRVKKKLAVAITRRVWGPNHLIAGGGAKIVATLLLIIFLNLQISCSDIMGLWSKVS